MMSRAWCCLALLVGTVACERLPDELVYVAGALADHRGQPLVDAQVQLLQARTQCLLGPIRHAPGTEPGAEWTPIAEARTDGSGNYVIELLYGQIRERQNVSYCYRLRSVSPEGAELQSEFDMYEWDALLGTAQRWDEAPTVEVKDGQVFLGTRTVPGRSFPFPKDPEFKPWNGDYRYFGWQLWSKEALPQPGATEALPYWIEPFSTDHVSAQLDGRLLEDFASPVFAIGGHSTRQPRTPDETGELERPIEVQEEERYLLSLRSPLVAVDSPGIVPPSRGSTCAWNNEVAPDTCPITDGRMDTRASFTTNGPIDFELPRPLRPSTFVIRGLQMSLQSGSEVWAVRVSGSADGVTYETLGVVRIEPKVRMMSYEATISSQDGSIDETSYAYTEALGYTLASLTPPAEPVQFIRMELATEALFHSASFSEISLFE